MPRYNLLLNELLKKTWEGHPDKKELQVALKRVGQVTEFLNEKQREKEQGDKLLVLQKLMNNVSSSFETIRPDRKYVGDEIFRAQLNVCLRLFVFSDSILVLTNKRGGQELSKMKYRFHNEFTSEFQVSTLPAMEGNPFPLRLYFSKNRRFILPCKDEQQAHFWCNKISSTYESYTKSKKERDSQRISMLRSKIQGNQPTETSPTTPNTSKAEKSNSGGTGSANGSSTDKKKGKKKELTVEVWENQRWVAQWSASNLLPVERPSFSDEQGHPLQKDNLLQVNFVWSSNWEVEMNEMTDRNGWRYALAWMGPWIPYQMKVCIPKFFPAKMNFN